MSDLLSIYSACAATVVAALLVWAVSRKRRLEPAEPAEPEAEDFIASKTRQRIAVHLDDGQSVRGVLVAVHSDCVVLNHAKALGDHIETPVDGEAVFPRARVSWVQLLPPEEPEPAV